MFRRNLDIYSSFIKQALFPKSIDYKDQAGAIFITLHPIEDGKSTIRFTLNYKTNEKKSNEEIQRAINECRNTIYDLSEQIKLKPPLHIEFVKNKILITINTNFVFEPPKKSKELSDFENLSNYEKYERSIVNEFLQSIKTILRTLEIELGEETIEMKKSIPVESKFEETFVEDKPKEIVLKDVKSLIDDVSFYKKLVDLIQEFKKPVREFESTVKD